MELRENLVFHLRWFSVFFGSKRVVGIDVGSSSIKIAELELSKNGGILKSFGYLPTPPGSAQGGDISNLQLVSQAIQRMLRQAGIRSKNAAAALYGTAVIVKKITIPKVDLKLLDQQVRFEAEQYVPFDLNEITLAYHVLKNSAQPDTMDLLLVAAQNALVGQYANVVLGAQLGMNVLDVAGFALANTFELNYGRLPGETIALLNVGATVTHFVVVHDGEVVFVRDLPVGGSQYTMEISKELGISFQEAESLKLSAVAKKEVPPEVHTVMSTVNDTMTDEMRNSFDFFSASVSGLTISKCYYTGGGAAIPGLVPQVAAAAQISFDPLNPFLRVRPGNAVSPPMMNQLSPFSSIVVGLAMRKLGDT